MHHGNIWGGAKASSAACRPPRLCPCLSLCLSVPVCLLCFVFACVWISAAVKAAECKQTERRLTGPDKHQALCLPNTVHMTRALRWANQEGSSSGLVLCCPTLIISGLTTSHPTQVPSLWSTQPICPVASLVVHNHSTIPYLILSILSPPPTPGHSFTNTLHSTSTASQSDTSICEHNRPHSDSPPAHSGTEHQFLCFVVIFLNISC